MESKKWLWVVIVCLAIIAVYQIVQLTGGNSPDSLSPEIEPSFRPDQQTTHTASFAELPGTREEQQRPVIELAKVKKPQEPSTVTIERSVPSLEAQEQDIVDAADTVILQDPLSPVDDQPIVDTPQVPAASVLLVESSKRGLVRGIICSEDRGSALIDETIVQTGTIIGDVKVVNIYAGEVEFEKEGNRWIQKVSEAPDEKWQ